VDLRIVFDSLSAGNGRIQRRLSLCQQRPRCFDRDLTKRPGGYHDVVGHMRFHSLMAAHHPAAPYPAHQMAVHREPPSKSLKNRST
jgi:hypothetical protein